MLAPRGFIVERLGFQIAFVLAAALLPLTAVSLINSVRALQEMRARSEVALTGETMMAASREIQLIQEARGSVAAIAAMIGPLIADDAACTATLRDFQAAHPVYAQVSFLPVNGQLACSSTGKRLDLSQNPTFLSSVQDVGPGFYVSRHGGISGISVIGVSHPVVDAAGTYIGFAAISLPHSALTLERAARTAQLHLLTFDHEGEILSATVGLDNTAAALPRDRALTTLMTDRPFSFSGVAQSGEERVFSVVPLVPGELFALGNWPAEESSGLGTFQSWIPFLAPALIWTASLVVAWLSVEWLVNRPIRRMNGWINAFASGERKITDVEVRGAPLELREMAAAFALMTDAVMRDEAQLEDTVHQKEVLLREVHHRVKNNLQMIASIMNMHSRKVKTPETRQVIRGLQGRVMSLATIHRELYQTKGLGDVHAAELLDAIARQTVNVAAGSERRVDLRQHFDDIRITPDQAVPLALLMGEGLLSAVTLVRPVPPEMAVVFVRLTQTAADAALLRIDAAGAITPTGPAEMSETISLSAQLMGVFAMQLGGKLDQATEGGHYSLTVSFALRPLVEGEDRHPVHATAPV